MGNCCFGRNYNAIHKFTDILPVESLQAIFNLPNIIHKTNVLKAYVNIHIDKFPLKS